MKYKSTKSQSRFLSEIRGLLIDFHIKITTTIESDILSLYPDELAAERYTRKLILKKLEKLN